VGPWGSVISISTSWSKTRMPTESLTSLTAPRHRFLRLKDPRQRPSPRA
jgi:hypothetical protein